MNKSQIIEDVTVKDIPDWIKKLPNKSVCCPRDDEELRKTKDFVFLGRLAIIASDLCGRVGVFRDKQTRAIHYMIIDEKNSKFYSCQGDPGSLPKTYEHIQNIRYQTLLKLIRKEFYWLRRKIADKQFGNHTLTLNGNTLVENGDIDFPAINCMNKSLKHPITFGGDPLAHFLKIESLSRHFLLHEENDLVAAKNLPICPVDGPVKPLIGKYRSSDWTWIHLCGREYQLFICPECLGLFWSGLTLMS